MEIKRDSSAGLESPTRWAANLPPQILDKVSERVCLVTAMVATCTAGLSYLSYLFQDEWALALERTLTATTVASVILASLLLFFVRKWGSVRQDTLTILVPIYQVFVAFAIGLMDTSVPWNDMPVRGFTFVGVWFLISGFLLPNAPRRVAFVGVAGILSWWGAYQLNLMFSGIPPIEPARMSVLLGQMVIAAIWMFLINANTVATQVKQYRAEQLGSYQMDVKLGQGGMGEVWKARHKLLARDAAIKLLRPDVLLASTGREGQQLHRRFQREAQVTASLRSPHTVALYDFGSMQNGSFYYVMELLNGIDLQTVVDRFGPMPPGRVLNTLIGVCESLEEAHRAGLVHRDIKPKNIMLTKLGLQFDFVKVLDFGLVKITHQVNDSSATLEGITAGTPAYLPPEVATGSQEIDGRADLYSLGCVAYFLLTGRTVFEESSGMAQAVAHIQKEPEPPSKKSEVPIPPELEAIVMQLLAKSPSQRIQSAYELGRQLRGLRHIKEFCPYTAADWWSLHLPEHVSGLASPPVPETSEQKAVDSASMTVGSVVRR